SPRPPPARPLRSSRPLRCWIERGAGQKKPPAKRRARAGGAPTSSCGRPILTAAPAGSAALCGRSRTLRAKLAAAGTFVPSAVGNSLPAMEHAALHKHEQGLIELRADRPPANAMDLTLLADLLEAIELLRGAKPRALVVAGRPGFFSAGADL